MAARNPRDRRVKRRIAATAATAAIALSGPATAAARPAATRTPAPTRPAGDPVALHVQASRSEGQRSIDLVRRTELAGHRRQLAGALAAELPGVDPGSIESALEAADAQARDAYARGERPATGAGLPAALAAVSGSSDEELEAAFESMSRRALERRRPTLT